MKLEGQRALVVGMERSGRATVAFLVGQGARVTAADLHVVDTDVPFRLQTDELFDEAFDLIVISPGVPADLPGLERARTRGVPVIGEVELAAPYLRGPVIGITGTNGKTTTTALTGHILSESGVAVQVGGNIGTPVTGMISSSRDDQWNVLELSSFQLETVERFRAHIGVCLNVTQNHLDRHHSFENYVNAKGNLFRTQGDGDFAVLNAGDPVCVGFAGLTAGKVVWFGDSAGVEMSLDASRASACATVGGEELMPIGEIPIRGRHNVENVLAAALASKLAGVSLPQIAAAVRTFKAVEHRLEFVRNVNGVYFYNDSKATSVDATMKALDSFPGNLWVILGGKDKGSDYTVLRDALHAKARAALLIGAAAGKIGEQIEGAVPLIAAGTLDRAVHEAFARARAGDTVLLAPACASFDQFQSYEHRGKVFKQLVEELSGK